MNRRHRQRAFTLIEVLVALVIVAFGMGALLATLSSAAETTSYLREKSFGEWVALNAITDLRLSGVRPAAGTSSGDVDFAGEKFHWSQQVVDPGLPGILRVDVTITRANATQSDTKQSPAVATATGFLPLAMGVPSGIQPDWSLWSMSSSATPGTGAPAATTPNALTPTGPGGTPAPTTAPITGPAGLTP